MKLLFFILNKVETLEHLMFRLAEEGIRGATIFTSTGMARTLLDYTGYSFFTSLKSILDPAKEENRTILTVVRDEQIEIVLRVIEEVVGDLSRPDTGVVFTVPIDGVWGLGSAPKEKEEA